MKNKPNETHAINGTVGVNNLSFGNILYLIIWEFIELFNSSSEFKYKSIFFDTISACNSAIKPLLISFPNCNAQFGNENNDKNNWLSSFVLLSISAKSPQTNIPSQFDKGPSIGYKNNYN